MGNESFLSLFETFECLIFKGITSKVFLMSNKKEEKILAEKTIKLMLAEERIQKIGHENALFKVDNEETREELLELISRDEGHYDFLKSAGKNFEEAKNASRDQFETFSQVVDLGEKNEREILNGLVRIHRTILMLYYQIKHLLEQFDDDKVVRARGMEFEVGKLRGMIEIIIRDEEEDILIAERALARYYNSHLNQKPQRWGFQKNIL